MGRTAGVLTSDHAAQERAVRQQHYQAGHGGDAGARPAAAKTARAAGADGGNAVALEDASRGSRARAQLKKDEKSTAATMSPYVVAFILVVVIGSGTGGERALRA